MNESNRILSDNTESTFSILTPHHSFFTVSSVITPAGARAFHSTRSNAFKVAIIGAAGQLVELLVVREVATSCVICVSDESIYSRQC